MGRRLGQFDRFKGLAWIGLCALLSGCATVDMPSYIKDDHPYKKIYYSEFGEVLEAAQRSLDRLGWDVSGQNDPAVFEREKSFGEIQEQTLLFTEVRQTSMFIGSRYSRVNVYLRLMPDKGIEVEIRCMSATTIFLKTFYGYRNDKTANRIFKLIEEQL